MTCHFVGSGGVPICVCVCIWKTDNSSTYMESARIVSLFFSFRIKCVITVWICILCMLQGVCTLISLFFNQTDIVKQRLCGFVRLFIFLIRLICFLALFYTFCKFVTMNCLEQIEFLCLYGSLMKHFSGFA